MSKIPTALRIFGFDAKRFLRACQGITKYRADRRCFRERLKDDFAWGIECPILDEWSASSGNLGAYFHQDLTFARWIREDNPVRHVDVGSRIDGFIGHLAVFREVEVLDIRPQNRDIENIVFRQLDLMQDLPAEWVHAADSVSCLHTIEHFGLGRYGDSIDPDGYLRGLDQLKKIVKPGGRLYLSTPIGPQRIEFNAHRIFSAKTVVDWFDSSWEILRFAYLDDSETLHMNVSHDDPRVGDSFGCHAGIGMIVARKRS